jgi:hypothetical protein
MKKIILSALLYVMLISVNYEKSYATCPSGYSSTFTTLIINGCEVYVELCKKCEPASHDVALKIFGFTQINPSCTMVPYLTPSEVLTKISDILLTPSKIMYFCTGFEVPPCDPPTAGGEVSYSIPICWSKINISNSIHFQACDTADVNCDALYKWCFDGTSYIKTKIYQGVSGSLSSCLDSEQDVPDPPLNVTSGCFYLSTNCKP